MTDGLKLSHHAKYRLKTRYGLEIKDVEYVTYEPLNPANDTFWMVLNGDKDAIAVIRDNIVVTLLHMHHKLSNKVFGLND